MNNAGGPKLTIQDAGAEAKVVERVHRIQCAACPWKKSTVPERDIPGGYSERRHRGLVGTISGGGCESLLGGRPMMACHESPVGEEQACAGWVAYELCEGNNIGLRLRALRNPDAFDLVLDGPQHARIEDTFPKRSKTHKRTRASAGHSGGAE
jgi:hypothetical protein